MKAFAKVLGIVLVGLLLLLVAVGFALTHLVDPNDYKDEIRQLARDKANVDLQLKGDIGWSLFPWLGVELHDATLASAATPDRQLAQVQRLILSVRLLPLLLRRDLEMSDIKIDGLDLTASRDDQGRTNWAEIGRPAPKADPGAAPADTATGTSGESTTGRQPLKLNVESLTVRNSRVEYSDARNGARYAFEGIDLETGAIYAGTPIPIKLAGTASTTQPPVNATVLLNGKFRFDPASQQYALDDLQLTGDASGEPFNGKLVNYSASGQLAVDRRAQTAEWTSLKLTANDLKALGDLKLTGLESDPQLAGRVSIARLDLRAFLDSIGVELPAMADTKTLQRFEMNAQVQASRNALALDDFNFQLDDSTLKGRVAIADIARRALRIQLSGDRLDLDRYLPAKAAAARQANGARQEEVAQVDAIAAQGNSPLPEAPTQHAWSQETLLPVERLRSLDAEVDLGLQHLTLNRLPFEGASLKARAADGQLQLSALEGELFGGRFEANGALDVRGAQPQLIARERIKGVPVERILQAQGQKPPVEGQLDLDADLRSSGASQRTLIDNLGGTARFALRNGQLIDANVESQLCQGIALLNRKPLELPHAGQNTPFRQLSGSLSIVNGVARNQDLSVSVPGLAVKGAGDIDLRTLGLDYRLGITVQGDTNAASDPGCQVGERYADIEWPLQCRGPLELGAKACRLDREAMGQIVARAAGNRLNEKIEEKLGDKISPDIQNAIRGLLQRR
ncbi:cell envelope biogenesis protein AsmA [Pseudomonas oryzihabitans]|uniref:AsmA family protein n=1 Tax=Pseudomonas oryzihabitans TaxID=47885 RepID=UPI00165DF55C|nr:AsmA family protein [Pseudomonas psychrotolerans]QNQ97197.1 cell envelope biogenesis protein AsmA [Pseudomonas psychrotolerans]